ncbi:MAG: DNA alkylation repair protein [Cyclobacteriaceae bacterium]
MAEPLKYFFNPEFVSGLASGIKEVHAPFDAIGFQQAVLDDQWEQRELKERMRHITVCLGAFLPHEYPEAVGILMKMAHELSDFPAMVLSDFVEIYGLDHLDLSLDALELFTQSASAEFAIRPFIVKYEKETMGRMLDWSKHENHHLRRLASEGCRPRLPWAMALGIYKKNPALILPILENLKDDPSEYVRKSVANNLNDISKDNPETALKLGQAWYGKSERTNWIVKHGLRTLLKNGNDTALKIFGFKEKVNAAVSGLSLSDEQVQMGNTLHFSFDISNLDRSSSLLKVGFVVGYMKANGKVSEKIFHITEKEFGAGQRVNFHKKLSFKDLTTRKHYPGGHYLSIIINGVPMARGEFELTTA